MVQHHKLKKPTTKILFCSICIIFSGFIHAATAKNKINNSQNNSQLTNINPNKYNEIKFMPINIDNINHSNSNIQLYTVKTKSIPSLDFSIMLPRIYTANTCSADLFASLLAKQINDLNEEQSANKLQDIGSQYSLNYTQDYLMINVRSLSNQQQQSAEWLKNVLFHSNLSDEIFTREKKVLLQQIAENELQPSHVSLKNLEASIYGNHPYGQTCNDEDVKKLSLEDMKKYYSKQILTISLNKAKFLAVGDFNFELLKQDIQNLLDTQAQIKIAGNTELAEPQDGNTIAINAINPQTQPQSEAKKNIYHNLDISQAHVKLGNLFISRDNPDIFDLIIANYVLGGGGFNSRLMQKIREEQGLVYGISSTFNPLQQLGLFYIDFHTKNEQVDNVTEKVRNILNEFIKNGITHVELKQAQKFLLQSFSSRVDTNAKWLGQLATIAWYNLPPDYLNLWQKNINNAKLEDINKNIKKYFNEQKLYNSTVRKN